MKPRIPRKKKKALKKLEAKKRAAAIVHSVFSMAADYYSTIQSLHTLRAPKFKEGGVWQKGHEPKEAEVVEADVIIGLADRMTKRLQELADQGVTIKRPPTPTA